jgi:hypothetical protein
VPNFLPNLPPWPIVIGAGLLHCTLGFTAAVLAKRKGHDWNFWLPVGLIAGTPALIAAWRLSPIPKKLSDEQK